MKHGSPFGTHRVLDPIGVLPQPAWKLDNTMAIYDNEILIDVSALNIDSASFTQIKAACENDEGRIAAMVIGIVAQRGKHHNPVTGSGGMLIGTVAQIGSALADKIDVKVGDKIATLVSLSLTPLRIEAIKKIHLHKDQIEIKGQAILFETGLYARLPHDLDENLALAILDVAGAPAQTARLVQPGHTVVVIGGGGKSGTLCIYEAKKRAGATGCVIGVSPFAKDCERMKGLGWADHALQVDATDALALMDAVAAVTEGQLADVVINCVNIPNTEMGSILATRQHGKIYFFSMATSFTAAALGAEGVGKDVEMIVGNGYATGHAEFALGLLRESPKLRALFEQLYV
ncbi:MAG: zinc-binding dehydrogenase [Gammaproteobacteria bacterium]|uniref:L-erythro-3,5-diaminohexanoate dehydrogenase n=1 Tax=Rhodoferax sp. TaxID=50421 RepID=UPI0017C6D245|nr:zinc-binding dehydrogenase [Rhodoferax sp.]MBU3900564.1 zinc-binding dehydrogenase [Gammaproteobacteria bacterium]MBA3057531.1 zinc-binding dehydrogenase [Rhodoferax sp.]MBU3996469.1 zinc-binding dehydrogenase [Gammaproteobacteria bacterium]MBU4080009.1 zinc-binding dehydrogenase [Gammaproteobacteria bacterium]MBU4113465.1 zinc-binding dehydrogenase [Gammaproteobacteria bacterium]